MRWRQTLSKRTNETKRMNYKIKNYYAKWWEIIFARIFGKRINYESGYRAGYTWKGIVYITDKDLSK